MTDFADEARSRTAWLLRMAAPGQDAGSIIEYAATTPEPPVMGPHGIRTRGCPRCRRTMWMQREIWICAFCGHVEDFACPAVPTASATTPTTGPTAGTAAGSTAGVGATAGPVRSLPLGETGPQQTHEGQEPRAPRAEQAETTTPLETVMKNGPERSAAPDVSRGTSRATFLP